MEKFTVNPVEVMRQYRTIAVVGASKNPEKEAFTVPAYLQAQGYTIIPVNPTADVVNGSKAYPTLAGIPKEVAEKVEVVDVFRPSEEFPEVARQVAEMKKNTGRPFVFWGQLGLENEEAKKILSEAKIDYVMDKCMRVEHRVMVGWK
ncbi:MAG: CoA-binding protein [Nitrososphaerota archaeon]|jgi:predicted CoA-binding protein|nr:CoA-binding protein [Nitrososphaerota archaeon]MCL5672032.1 CoA-binding protein [Nitrososphaerota archaeon]MDG6903690.1 CoA-binding protein [Nitrososphaerota archaeon]MDG6911983.1 CoA-binding protein [Nitrososphaerota archaeon]MDG6924539.1 CoA-binding protein [Nitrososphaerota archaeon]